MQTRIMLTRNILMAVVVLAVAGWTVHSQTGAKAKVGDWVEYKQTNTFGAKDVKIKDVIVKQTVKAVDDKKVTIRIEMTVDGKTRPSTEKQISLDELVDPLKSIGKDKAKVEKLESGKETIEVANKKLECEWISFKTTSDLKGKTIETTTKVWINREIPVNGLVRSESSFAGGKFALELTGFGRGK
ncbi:MAG: hypothetical protein HY040_05440 [Planctomycetes bacterium]|nr:hypothetical protein [Planctomycetota bacterium]